MSCRPSYLDRVLSVGPPRRRPCHLWRAARTHGFELGRYSPQAASGERPDQGIGVQPHRVRRLVNSGPARRKWSTPRTNGQRIAAHSGMLRRLCVQRCCARGAYESRQDMYSHVVPGASRGMPPRIRTTRTSSSHVVVTIATALREARKRPRARLRPDQQTWP